MKRSLQGKFNPLLPGRGIDHRPGRLGPDPSDLRTVYDEPGGRAANRVTWKNPCKPTSPPTAP